MHPSEHSTMNETRQSCRTIPGRDAANQRVSSKDFEAAVRAAAETADDLLLESFGQHNIGLRLGSPERPLTLRVTGPVGQRLGCMGQPGATIVCEGSASDDVGYLNIGADIVVKGDATNGVCNAMAGGRVMIGGSIGARGLTMTKWNPDHERPEMWVLGSVGDTFAEFNCGGIGVVCGVEAKNPDNVLGYRPCVGMVGGKIYFRGSTDGSYSTTNAKLTRPDDAEWQWLLDRLPEFLARIGRPKLLATLSERNEWQLLTAITPQERALMFAGPMPMAEFRRRIWDKGFGGGDPLRDLAPGLERDLVGVVESGDLRRRKPFWANRDAAAPCTFFCPIHIPTIDRLRLIREGRTDEAYEMLLRYTPLPASVCGTICPNLCIQNCSREKIDYSIDASVLGRSVRNVDPPRSLPATGHKVAVIGGGPAGMAVAWHLALHGVEAHIYERGPRLGGKLAQTIPWERLSQAVWDAEIDRFLKTENLHVHLNETLSRERVEALKGEFDYVVVAVGAHQPRTLSFPGHERVIPALDYLKAAKSDQPMATGKQVVIIGAGNVGCDVAAEAYRLGAQEVVLVDIQKPLAFGKERAAAEALGATFRWPFMTREVTAEGLVGADGTLLPAQTVIISIGDVPNLPFLPESVQVVTVGGAAWIKTDAAGRTSDAQILAVGDVERPGLATNALGAGKRTAEYLLATFRGEPWVPFDKQLIRYENLTFAHYDPVSDRGRTEDQQAARCLSCGSCRDCHLCETICPTEAIARREVEPGKYSRRVDRTFSGTSVTGRGVPAWAKAAVKTTRSTLESVFIGCSSAQVGNVGQRRSAQAACSAASMARRKRSVDSRSWQPGQQLPGFLNQLTVLVILMPHFGQVTVIVLSSIIGPPRLGFGDCSAMKARRGRQAGGMSANGASLATKPDLCRGAGAGVLCISTCPADGWQREPAGRCPGKGLHLRRAARANIVRGGIWEGRPGVRVTRRAGSTGPGGATTAGRARARPAAPPAPRCAGAGAAGRRCASGRSGRSRR